MGLTSMKILLRGKLIPLSSPARNHRQVTWTFLPKSLLLVATGQPPPC